MIKDKQKIREMTAVKETIGVADWEQYSESNGPHLNDNEIGKLGPARLTKSTKNNLEGEFNTIILKTCAEGDSAVNRPLDISIFILR